MTEAEKAYQAALEEIERVKREGGTELDLSDERFRALDRIPASVADLPGLTSMNLGLTAVRDLGPLSQLTELQTLWLNQTGVTELNALADIASLKGLFLVNTPITNLAPLAKLMQLEILDIGLTAVADLSPLITLQALVSLDLAGTEVSDLRPIGSLQRLGVHGHGGVEFSDCEATRRDAELTRLSDIDDDTIRTRETLAYLNTLPPWPEPYLPKARPDGKPPEWIGLGDGDRPPLSPSPIPGRGLVPPAGLRRLTLSDARALLETGHPILRDRCQRVVADIDEALALQAIRIPNDPAQLAAHEALSRTLVLCKAALMGIHDAIPEDLSDQPIDDAAAGRLRAAFDAALESLKEAARYIDRKDHTPTYGGLLRLGAATGVASIMAMAPGVTLAVALPTVYACLYGPEAAKALKEFGKLGGS
ncbi:leucine-rich repeat domain-containing protein [Rhodobacter capsulatus]|uniref:leucine-rich repeat domain-containing protein n=1 Tax=Rhodobacter capsulatus TaxID=1061 RepID=UPI00103887A9|nr:leucine-rich repeat domain-containing protein [Rhodobacter capsulatus]